MCACACGPMCVVCVYVHMTGVHPYHSTLVEVREQSWMSVITFYVIWNSLLFCFCFVDQAGWPEHFQRFSCLWSSSHHRSTGVIGMHCIYVIFIALSVSDALWGFDLRATHLRSKCFNHWAISPAPNCFHFLHRALCIFWWKFSALGVSLPA